MLVRAEIDSLAAHEVKSSTITIAEGDAKKIELIGDATAEIYQKHKNILGQNATMAIEMLKKVSEGNVKITPDVLVTGDNGGGLLDVLLSQLIKKGITDKSLSSEISDIEEVPQNKGADNKKA